MMLDLPEPGAKAISSASSAPPHSQGFSGSIGWGSAGAQPPGRPQRRQSCSETSTPRPMTAPMASHQRGFSLCSRWITSAAMSTHHRKSKVTYWNRVEKAHDGGENPTASAARSIARRARGMLLPEGPCGSMESTSSRAIQPASTITPACARTEKKRSPFGAGPKISIATRAKRRQRRCFNKPPGQRQCIAERTQLVSKKP